MGSPLRAIGRIVALLAVIAGIGALQWLALTLRLPIAKRLPLTFHRLASRVAGIKTRVIGTMSPQRPVLFVCNHHSYLDIVVLGAVIPGSFVAKVEVSQWPVIGHLCRLQRTVFVDRRARFITEQRDEMIERLRNGDNLILFPEGTSSDGNRILAFKSALFSTAEIQVDGRPITVQPVSIAYTHLDGLPIGRSLRPLYAWYGDMEFASHIWGMMGLGRTTVTVEFHHPVTIDQFGSRKLLAQHCERDVAIGVAAAISGRPQGLPPPEEARPVLEPVAGSP